MGLTAQGINLIQRLIAPVEQSSILWNAADKAVSLFLRGFVRKMARDLYFKHFDHLQMLLLHLHTGCNYNCRYCYIDSEMKMSVDYWYRLLDEAKKMKVQNIGLAGGEPLMYEYFPEIFEKVLENNFTVNIITNGFLLDNWLDRIALERSRGHDIDIYISFDHPSLYEKMVRYPGSYEKIMNNVKRAVSLKIPVKLFVTVTTENVKLLPEIVKITEMAGVSVMIERCHPGREEKQFKRLKLNPEQWEFARKAVGVLARRQPRIYLINKILSEVTGNCCQGYLCNIAFLADGTAIPCPFAPKETGIGNIKKQSLKTLWKRYRNMREKWRVIPEECRSCSMAETCLGGCKTYVYTQTGRFDRRDPLCTAYKKDAGKPVIPH